MRLSVLSPPPVALLLLPSRHSAFCASLLGVSKSVNHINESLGPALIKSVSAGVHYQHDAAIVQM